ncbi:MAG: cyclic nucleotide-binding domain-containing protein [Elusimicrobiota bacterium]|jgi:CRP-like cAMP-binding protein
MTITEFLKDHVPFLKGITEEQARRLAQCAEQRTYKQNQTVIFKGVTVDGLHIVATGKVAVYIRPEKNKEWLRAAELGAGEVFGERSIIEFSTATATIKGASAEALLFVLQQAAFRELLETDAALKERTLALIESRTRPAAARQPAAPSA